MQLHHDDILKKLRSIEARAALLQEECHNTIKMLEADSSATSTRKGLFEALRVKAIADFDYRRKIKEPR